MKKMTINELDKIVKWIHSRNLKSVIEAVKSFEEFRTTIPFSVLQEAIEQFNLVDSNCCAEKAQAEADYKALLKAIVDLDNDLKGM